MQICIENRIGPTALFEKIETNRAVPGKGYNAERMVRMLCRMSGHGFNDRLRFDRIGALAHRDRRPRDTVATKALRASVDRRGRRQKQARPINSALDTSIKDGCATGSASAACAMEVRALRTASECFRVPWPVRPPASAAVSTGSSSSSELSSASNREKSLSAVTACDHPPLRSASARYYAQSLLDGLGSLHRLRPSRMSLFQVKILGHRIGLIMNTGLST